MIDNSTLPPPTKPVTVAAAYLPLYLYLGDRRANILSLTFAEIESLLGFPLPDLARKLPEWWAETGPDSPPSPQSSCWTQASMVAKPSLSTDTVVFERVCVTA
jgi:hypothetical protein